MNPLLIFMMNVLVSLNTFRFSALKFINVRGLEENLIHF